MRVESGDDNTKGEACESECLLQSLNGLTNAQVALKCWCFLSTLHVWVAVVPHCKTYMLNMHCERKGH